MEPEFATKTHKLTDDELARMLGELEQRYGMTSAEFLLRYNRGELGCDDDFIDWAGLLYAAEQPSGRSVAPARPHA
jgi:hypothetical protein